MNFSFTVQGKRVKKNKQNRMLFFVVDAFLTYWGIQNEKDSLVIELDSQELPKDVSGASTYYKKEYSIHVNQSNYNSLSDLFVILAHEIVHIKQYHKKERVNELVKINGNWANKKLWKGKDIANFKYDEQPHEIEAYYFQELMLEELHRELDFYQKNLN